jgi:uncharacterized membrane protein
MKLNTIRKIVFGGLIGGIYAALTLALAPISYGEVQFRIAEALTVLPFFSAFSTLGLFIGCLISNILSPIGPLDMIFGSLATLVAAIMTYYIGKSRLKFKRFIAPLPAVIVNAIVVGLLISYSANIPFIIPALQVGFGQLVVCYALGLPLLMVIEKNEKIKSYLR